eukprot:4332672-Amphidinium_carterae.1
MIVFSAALWSERNRWSDPLCTVLQNYCSLVSAVCRHLSSKSSVHEQPNQRSDCHFEARPC